MNTNPSVSTTLPHPRRANDPLPLGALSEALAGIDAHGEALRRILDFAIEATRADTGAIVVTEDDGYSVVAARDASGAALPDTAGLLSGTVVHDVLSGRAPVCIGDVLHHDRYGHVPSLVSLRLHSVLCVPMTLGRRVLGALYLAKRLPSASFSERHMRDLTALAALTVPFLAEVRATPKAPAGFDSLLGESLPMMEVRRLIEKVGPTDLSVLIVGETGTGKELTARAIHELSRRSARPLVATNCSAVAEGLLEAELFGCKKGAFTGAVADREGRIETADRSTLFLDEVGDMPLAMQAALLRVLQEKEVVRLGENRARPVDFRLVAATNKDLDAEVAGGRFREDLLFRLREIVVPLPPLRARGDDILFLARLFLRQCERQLSLPVHALSRPAECALSEHAWPGNVRELRGAMRRACVLSDKLEIRIEDLCLARSISMAGETTPVATPADVSTSMASVPRPPDLGDLKRTLADARDDFVTSFVATVLAEHGGNREAAAAALGISVRSLYRYLSRSDARPSELRPAEPDA